MEKKRCYKDEKLKKEKAKEALKVETLVNKILRMKRSEKKLTN
jgi:KaiC/GvpD/RAD55 family RecA-like ATPase